MTRWTPSRSCEQPRTAYSPAGSSSPPPTPADLERLLRGRELVRLLPGVFLDHTGVPTWQQRAWAGVLHYGPAALAGSSTLRAVNGPGWRRYDDAGRIELMVGHDRRVAERVGYRVRRVRRFTAEVQWNAAPPRQRVEFAAIDVAQRAPDRLARIGVLADVCQTRRSTARRLSAALASRDRAVDRMWLEAVLGDLGSGTCSVLEHAYLSDVERAHGLSGARRQVAGRSSRGPLYRDVEYAGGLIVELDGRLFHDSAGQRDLDLDRDLDAALVGQPTVRLGWGQVFGRPCWTAVRIGLLLARQGWSGRPVPCGAGCQVAARVACGPPARRQHIGEDASYPVRHPLPDPR